MTWLYATVEDLAQKTEAKDFVKSTGEGTKARIAQRQSNKSGFMVVEAYRGGGRRGSFVVPEGREGRGGEFFAAELGKASQ